jgi:transposase
MSDQIPCVELDVEGLLALGERAEGHSLQESDYAKIKSLVDTVVLQYWAMQGRDISMKRVLRMMFGACTEKTRNLLKGTGKSIGRRKDGEAKKKGRRKGHGRRPVSSYWGADREQVAHPELKAGERCPECRNANLYAPAHQSQIIRLVAQPLVAATVFELETLRCAGCGKVFSAQPPAEAGEEKYDPNVGPGLAVQRYGYGMPMNRIEQMQQDCGIPLPAGTQWELIRDTYREIYPVWPELLRQAAQADLFHNDDTVTKILAVEKQIMEEAEEDNTGGKRRTGVFTTGIVAQRSDVTIAVFFSGRRHAGENLQDLLDKRDENLRIPIQMSDGLNRNVPATSKTHQANCNSHARREFVDLVEHFPEDSAHVLEVFGELYKNDAQTKEMDAEQRLRFHQQHSSKLMAGFKKWLEGKMQGRQVEPNSSLGKAINYILKRWKKLTLFLRKPGVPIDNNVAERILKTAIRHRNNSLFYNTLNGAHIGDMFMSLILTCRFCGVAPFHYLVALRQHAKHLAETPAAWMPWNYQSTIETTAGG